MSNELATISANQTGLANSIGAVQTPAEKKRVLRAINAAESLNDAVSTGEVFEVVDIFQTPGVRASRNAQMPDMPCLNTYFLLNDGRTLMSQSDGIARGAQAILSMFPNCGRDVDEGYIALAVTERKLPNGNTIKNVVPVD